MLDLTIQCASMLHPVVRGTAQKKTLRNHRGSCPLPSPKPTLVLTVEQLAIAAQIMEINAIKRGSSSAWDFSLTKRQPHMKGNLESWGAGARLTEFNLADSSR